MDHNRSKQRGEIIRIPSNNLLLAQNVIKTACSRCNWFCFSLDEKLAGDLLANQYVWESQSRNYFRQSFENCTNSSDNLLSSKVKSGSIVVGIADSNKTNINIFFCLASNRIRKCGKFKLWLCKVRRGIVVKYMPHVQHAYFSLFNR